MLHVQIKSHRTHEEPLTHLQSLRPGNRHPSQREKPKANPDSRSLNEYPTLLAIRTEILRIAQSQTPEPPKLRHLHPTEQRYLRPVSCSLQAHSRHHVTPPNKPSSPPRPARQAQNRTIQQTDPSPGGGPPERQERIWTSYFLATCILF